MGKAVALPIVSNELRAAGDGMSGVHALAAAGLWMIACAALVPAQADEAAKSATEGQAGDGGAVNGNKLFATTCGFCHEDGGRQAGKGPKLAGTKRSDEFIINRITNGKPDLMPAFGRVYSQDQIRQILAYIRSLQP
jgi:mono/diheme cytochrome c family protein